MYLKSIRIFSINTGEPSVKTPFYAFYPTLKTLRVKFSYVLRHSLKLRK